MIKEIWNAWEAKYEDGHKVFAKDISYCGLTPLEKDLFEVMKKHNLYKLNVVDPEQIEITFDPAYEANLTWKKG
jgi:hypothetical protein